MHIRAKAEIFRFKFLAGLLGALLILGMLSAPARAAPPTCGGKTATIVGTGGADRIVGTSQADVIVARGGNDVIFGRGGADLICSGAGRDRVSGGGGRDRIWAGTGDDRVRGGDGRDRVNGGSGVDACLSSEVLTNCEADLTVDVQGPASMIHNETKEWTFDYVNKGPSPVVAMTLTVSFAPRLTVTTVGAGCSDGTAGTVICQLGTLGVAGSGEIVISAEGPSACTEPQTDSLEVSAVVAASVEDPAPADNADALTTTYQDKGC